MLIVLLQAAQCFGAELARYPLCALVWESEKTLRVELDQEGKTN